MILNEDILYESSGVNSYYLGLEKSERKGRDINISYNSSHSGRMKISAPGKRIDRNRNYGTIYYDNNKVVEDKNAPLSNVDLKGKERRAYEDIVMRNHTLMNCANNNKNINGNNVNIELVHDELLYRMGYDYERSSNGVCTVYDGKKGILYKRDINGEYIEGNTTILDLVDKYNSTHNDKIDYIHDDLE